MLVIPLSVCPTFTNSHNSIHEWRNNIWSCFKFEGRLVSDWEQERSPATRLPQVSVTTTNQSRQLRIRRRLNYKSCTSPRREIVAVGSKTAVIHESDCRSSMVIGGYPAWLYLGRTGQSEPIWNRRWIEVHRQKIRSTERCLRSDKS